MKIITFNIAMISYLLASLEYFLYLVYRKSGVSTLATGPWWSGCYRIRRS